MKSDEHPEQVRVPPWAPSIECQTYENQSPTFLPEEKRTREDAGRLYRRPDRGRRRRSRFCGRRKFMIFSS